MKNKFFSLKYKYLLKDKNKMEMPFLGLGTYQIENKDVEKVVLDALEIGFRHIDTASRYENETWVWDAIFSSWVDRENIFLTTKIWTDDFKFSYEATEKSLEKLKCDYIDLVLLHWPQTDEDNKHALEGLLRAKQDWLIKNIWVSNFTKSQLEEAIEFTQGQILTNQIEYHPFLGQDVLRNWCKDHYVNITAYAPFAHWHAFKDETLISLAKKYNVSVAQIIIWWLSSQKPINVIAKSSHKKHLQDIWAGQFLDLEPQDIQIIQSLPKTYRYFNPPFAPVWDIETS